MGFTAERLGQLIPEKILSDAEFIIKTKTGTVVIKTRGTSADIKRAEEALLKEFSEPKPEPVKVKRTMPNVRP